MKEILVNEREIMRLARGACEEIQRICQAESLVSQNGNFQDPVQTLLMRRSHNIDSLVLPILEESAIQAEKKSAGAGEKFLKISSVEIKKDILRKSSNLEQDSEWNLILEKINQVSIPMRKRDLQVLTSKGEKTYQKILEEIISKLCANDRIISRKSPLQNTSIIRETGYTFEDLGIDPRFFSKGIWNRKNVRVVIVDGIIEKIGEIHAFLEECSSKRTPAVIFCLDALPDITETLVKNFNLGNLDVVLVKVPVDEINVNTLADLAVVFGVETISAARGETVSLGLSRQISFADRVIITKNKINIEREKDKDRVRNHIVSLRKRINDDINLSIILEPRIRRLISSAIQVDIGVEDQKNDPFIVEKIDRVFRSFQGMIKLGFIEKNDFEGFSSDKIDLLFEGKHVVPAEMAYQAIKIFLSTREAIRSISVGIRQIQH